MIKRSFPIRRNRPHRQFPPPPPDSAQLFATREFLLLFLRRIVPRRSSPFVFVVGSFPRFPSVVTCIRSAPSILLARLILPFLSIVLRYAKKSPLDFRSGQPLAAILVFSMDLDRRNASFYSDNFLIFDFAGRMPPAHNLIIPGPRT